MLQYYYDGKEISENLHCWKTKKFHTNCTAIWPKDVTQPIHKHQDAPSSQWNLLP
jgi:hypothetical protein